VLTVPGDLLVIEEQEREHQWPQHESRGEPAHRRPALQ
jgi:hypothetical protein